ncbi:MAG: DUF2490 domain-containing protein [Candidatus Omnitrophica bacterium]|nr:DUF2490 domain-containing protein [Candidatus Omnitrophota bacterium]
MKKLSIFFIVCIAVLCFSQGSMVFANDDLKMFNFYQITYKINDSFDVFIQPDMRFKDDINNFDYYHIRGGIVYHALKNLDLGSTYRFVQSKNSAGKWLNEYRLELDIAPKITIGRFKLVNRSRFEYRNLPTSTDRWRYRNLSKIAYPVKIGDFEFTPYISEEIFCDFEIGKINLNWITVGVDKKITKNLTLGLFYLNETVRVGTRSEWDTNHVIGTKVMMSF